MLELNKLTFFLAGKKILDSISLNIKQGERLALVGPNGSGKTTLLRCLLGLIKTRKSVFIDGEDIHHFSRNKISEIMAYLPQTTNTSNPFTIYEFIKLSLYKQKKQFVSQKLQQEKVIDSYLQLTEIMHLKHAFINSLSGGERQKAYLATALVRNTPIIIFDEPCSHLDPRQNISIQNLLDKIFHLENKTCITVTHDLNWAASGHDKVIGLSSGRVVSDTPADTFLTDQNLNKIFGGNWHIAKHPVKGEPMVLPS